MELDVRADEVGNDVAHQGLGDVLPVRRVLVDRRRDPPQPRCVRAVSRLEVPYRVGLCHLAAALDELVGGSAQSRDPLLRDDLLE
jgi:hypothetical protein